LTPTLHVRAAPSVRPVAGVLMLCGLAGPALAQQVGGGAQLPRTEVIGTTPMPGSAQPLTDVPTSARVYAGRSIENAGPAGTTRALDDRGASFTVDETAGSRYLADVSFRGFTASPLLGSPQGLSVFLDGALALGRGWSLVVEIRNLFDRAYASGSLLGADFFTGPGRTFSPDYVSEAFRTPGAPRLFWLGLRYGTG